MGVVGVFGRFRGVVEIALLCWVFFVAVVVRILFTLDPFGMRVPCMKRLSPALVAFMF